MKRDMNLIQELLLMLEAAATDRGFSFEEGEAETLKRTLDEIRYNLQQAEEMGLIEVGSKPLNGEWIILRLTPRGHGFLERGQNTEQNHLASVKLPAASPSHPRQTAISADIREALGAQASDEDFLSGRTVQGGAGMSSLAPSKDLTTVETSSPPQPKAMLTLKPTFMGMSLDLDELLRRAKAWWKRKK